MDTPTTDHKSIPLETSEELYENAPCGYLSTLPNGLIVRANQTFLDLLGYQRADVLAGVLIQELMTMPGRVFYDTHFGPLLLMQGFVKEIACDLLRPNRKPLAVLINAVRVVDSDGAPALFRFTVFDATERRRYEANLLTARQRAEHSAAIVEASEDAILSVEPDGRVRTWNKGAENIFGYDSAEIRGRNVVELLIPPAKREIFDEILENLRAGRPIRREVECIARDGSAVEVSMSLTPHIEPPGELTGVSAILRDITAQSQADKARRESDERMRLATAATGVGIWELNVNTGRLWWNPQMFRIYGIDESVGGSVDMAEWRSRIIPADIWVLEEMYLLKDPSWSKIGSREFRIVKAGDAATRYVQAVATVRHDEGGKAEWIVGTNLDITDQKKAESTRNRQELLESLVKFQEAERNRIARDLHDHLGQQATALRLGLTRLEFSNPSETATAVENIKALALQIDKDISFLAFELRPNVLERMELGEAIDNFAAQWSANYNIPIEVQNILHKSGRLPADIETNLYRIAQEALNNILKHAAADRVNILLKTTDSVVELIVEDNGRGFDSHPSPELPTEPGHGLGLIGMKERVAIIDGTIEIESSIGVGTTIYVRAPLKFNSYDDNNSVGAISNP